MDWKNSGIIWWLSSWISTSLKSSTHLLIWLRQMPPHSGKKSTIYSWLAPIADNFVCAPASQAYVERIFSVCVCGILCSSRCSSMQQLLEIHACLKLNQKVLCATGFALWELSSVTAAFKQLKTMVDSYFLAYVAIWCCWHEKFVFLNK